MTDMGEAEIVGAKERRPEEHWTLQRQEVAQVQSRGRKVQSWRLKAPKRNFVSAL